MSGLKESQDLGIRGRRAKFFAIGLLASMLTACGGVPDFIPFIGGDDEDDETSEFQGERLSVLSLEQKLEADPTLADIDVALPAPYVNEAWPQPGGYASHAMHHLQIPAEITQAWKTNAGQGSNGNARLTASPVVGDGKIFVRDSEAGVAAFDLDTGRRVWEVDLTPRKRKSFEGSGGGVAYEDGRVYVSTGYGFIVALDAATGAELWRQTLALAIHSAPTISDARVFVSTFENQLYALNAEDGEILWNHRGIAETARLLVSPSVAVAGEIVVAPYSSGEVYALRAQNGRVAWSDSLIRTGRLNAISALNDIAGRPVIDRGFVYAISHSGRMVSIDVRSGERVWTRNVGGVQTPWIAGDYIYVVSIDSEVVCLSRRDGRIRWIRPLQQFKNEKKREDRIEWSGPVLAGDRLIVVSSRGRALSISPYTGDVLGQIEMPEGTFISPIVADEMVILLTDEAELIAYR